MYITYPMEKDNVSYSISYSNVSSSERFKLITYSSLMINSESHYTMFYTCRFKLKCSSMNKRLTNPNINCF